MTFDTSSIRNGEPVRPRAPKRLAAVLAAVAAFAGLFGSAAPASADTVIAYHWPANTLSPQFRLGSCIYRIWYGQYGNTPFAKVRLYAGDCGFMMVGVRARDATQSDSWYNTTEGPFTGGRDSCGSYYELQSTGAPNTVAVGMRAYFHVSSNGSTVEIDFYHFGGGRTPTVYRRC